MGRLSILKNLFSNKKVTKEEVLFKKKFNKTNIEIWLENKKGKINLKDFLESYNDKEIEYFREALVLDLDLEKNLLKLNYEDIYNLSENELEYFNLPKYYQGVIDIKNRSYFLNPNPNGLQFELSFLDFKSKYNYIDYDYYVSDSSTGKKFFLSKKQRELVKKILDYNKKNKENPEIEDQFQLLELIQKYTEIFSINYSEQLDEFQNLESIEDMQIDFVKNPDKDDTLEVLPRIESFSEEKNKKLQERFKKAKRVNHYYELEVDNKKLKLIFNSKLNKALEVLKEEPEITEEEFISQSSKVFTDERLEQEEIEIIYGPRVKGLGYLNYRSSSMSNNSDINWLDNEFPYIQTTENKISLKPNHIEIIKKSIENSDENKPIIVEIDGVKVIIPTVEDAKNEIEKIENRIIDFLKYKTVKEIQELIDFFTENLEKDYYEKDGFFVENPKDLNLLEKYKESLYIEELEKKSNSNKENEKKESLLLKDNLEDIDYEEEKEIAEKEFEYVRPKALREGINLFDHQKKGVAKLQKLYSQNPINGVLLADDMGLGKTIQILTFLAWLKEEKITRNNLKAIIVMPTSLINNWHYESRNKDEVGEIQKFFYDNTFKIKAFKGKLSRNKVQELEKLDIIITSYESLRLNHIEIGKIKWNLLICDESQKIKNPTTLITTAIKTQNAKFKISCSATPIENTSEDLWCLIDFVKPGLLGSLKEFKTKFAKPIISNQSKIEVIQELNNSLKGKIDDFYIRRTKEVLNRDNNFPKKIIKYYNTLPTKEQDLNFEQLSRERYDTKTVLPIIQKMLMVSSHPDLISNSDLITKNLEELEKESSKIGTLKYILNDVKGKSEKVIIFTKYKKMQKILSVILNTWYNMSPSIINGDVNFVKRKEALDRFKQSKGFNIIILSPEAAGVGLNITQANHVIHYTRHWNPAKEEQATDRAYRIGQKKDVYVHYPILSYNKNYKDVVTYNLENWVEKEMERTLEKSTPEEKLNYIIMKKKKMLKDFFLATPLDISSSDFLGTMN